MDDGGGSDDNDDDDNDDQKVRQSSPLEYKRLITIRAGKPKGHITEALKVDQEKVRRLSLSEQELAKATASYGADLIRHVFSCFYFKKFVWIT